MSKTTTLTAPDIECEGCAKSIQNALGLVPGVANVVVNIQTKTVTVEHDEQAAPRVALVQALDKAGFPVGD